MGVILDSSIVIAADRRREPPRVFVRRMMALAGDQEAALSSIGLTEIVHGIYRSNTAEQRARREEFVQELLQGLPVYAYTKETAMLAGRIDGEQRSRGVVIPFPDLLIGATALHLGYAVLTANIRHFQLIPGLQLLSL